MRSTAQYVLLVSTLMLSSLTCAQPISPPANCSASQLSLATDNESGNFDGMMKSGTLLVLRNISSTPCRVSPLPRISFRDASDKELKATVVVAGAIGMHPGPVVPPVVVAAGAELTATLRWISGEVFDHTTCIAPTQIAVEIGDSTLHTMFKGSMCGEDPDHVTATVTRLMPDPVYKPQA